MTSLLASAGGQTLQDLSYEFDPAGNIRRLADWAGGGSQDFTYDDLDRLARAVGAYGTQSYEYDELGNILNKSELPSGAGPAALPSARASSAVDPASHVLDRNRYTRWTAATLAHDEWLAVDLGRQREFAAATPAHDEWLMVDLGIQVMWTGPSPLPGGG